MLLSERVAQRHTPGSDRGQDWRDRGACVGADPELWFAEHGTTADAEARRICGLCPVTQTCLDWAIDTGQRFGVWGGLDTHERAQVRRRRQIHAHPLAGQIRQHAATGRTEEQIAAAMGYSRWTVRRVRRDMGIALAPGRPAGAGSFWSEQEEATLRRLAASGYRDRQIATALGRTTESVATRRAKRGIPAGSRVGRPSTQEAAV